MPGEYVPLLIVLLPLLALSGVCSGMETALFRLLRRDRERLGLLSPHAGRAADALLRDKGDVLVTILLLNMVTNVTYFVLVSVLSMAARSALASVVLSVGSLLAIILVGEVLAKLIAGAQRVRVVMLTAPTLLVVHRALTPIRAIITRGLVRPIIRLIHPGIGDRPMAVTSEELRGVIGLGARTGVLEEGEQEILREVVEMSRRRVREIMTPRREIRVLDLRASREDAVAIARESGHGELPGVEGSLDKGVAGIVDLRRAFAQKAWDPRAHMRACVYIPENIRLDRALEVLRGRGEHVALCVDEHGGLSGLLEIESIVEALAIPWSRGGARARDEIVSVGLGSWIVPGRLSVRDFREVFPGADRGEDEAIEATTLGGAIADLLDRLPREGDEVSFAGYRLRVRRVDGLVVREIEVMQG